ncbi:MAG: flagellar basal-body rod protein FlgG [Thermoleophilaceae bacterium]|jgi:flagellar basal-body rod protein FlgG|nr:flagellar basal-body rod protein FlgG [Thermoleophilaceae bacterium]
MIDGIGAARSGLSAQGQRMDALANDIANVNTAGYAPERTGFQELVNAGTPAGVSTTDLGPDFQQGALQQTGQPLDMGIEGDGFFQVTRQGGQLALVRSGAFSVDASGQVVTATGERLYPPLTLPAGTGPEGLAVAPSGLVTVNGQPIGQVQIVTVPARGGLIRNGDGSYSATTASGAPVPATGAKVRQGTLEESGTDLVDATVGTIATRTAFTASVGSLHAYDEMLGALIELASREDRK